MLVRILCPTRINQYHYYWLPHFSRPTPHYIQKSYTPLLYNAHPSNNRNQRRELALGCWLKTMLRPRRVGTRSMYLHTLHYRAKDDISSDRSFHEAYGEKPVKHGIHELGTYPKQTAGESLDLIKTIYIIGKIVELHGQQTCLSD